MRRGRSAWRWVATGVGIDRRMGTGEWEVEWGLAERWRAEKRTRGTRSEEDEEEDEDEDEDEDGTMGWRVGG